MCAKTPHDQLTTARLCWRSEPIALVERHVVPDGQVLVAQNWCPSQEGRRAPPPSGSPVAGSRSSCIRILDARPRRQCARARSAIASTFAARASAIPCLTTLDQHAGAVFLGGPMSANDSDDYIRREIDWIEIPLREQRPFLGICLGAQMLAMQLGARVAPHARGADPDRLLSDPPDRGGPHALCPKLAGTGLSLASRRI